MQPLNRRNWLRQTSLGFGFTALAGLAHQEALAANARSYTNPLALKEPHFAPKAKHVIFLCMRGGPPHVDTFDYKPDLEKYAGKAPGETGVELGDVNSQRGRTLRPSFFPFQPRGESGIPISDAYPHLAEHADKLCLINGAHTDIPNHPQALVQLHTGNFQFVRPSMGAWILYGLGTESQNLPGFITVKPPERLGGAQNYGSSFLPAVYQGTRIANVTGNGAGIGNIANARFDDDLQRKQLDLLQSMNRGLADRHEANSQLEGVIESYELAFKMQSAVPELMELTGETEATLEAYGVDRGRTNDFGRQCLLARRFVEAGVRFVELTHEGWDLHNGLTNRLTQNAEETDRPMAALVNDLAERGLLDETLIVWSGEFGRTPAVRREDGRDHNSTGFSMWMCGGGVKGGLRYGATDPFGIAAVEDEFHVHDLHATILHLLGLDHEKLTYRYAGRDFRLTDVFGHVARDVIA